MNFYLFREAKKSVYEDFCPYHYIVRADSAANRKLNEHQISDPIKVTKILLEQTQNQPETNAIVQRKYLRQMIDLSARNLEENPERIRPHRQLARKELRRLLPNALIGRQYGMKLKVLSLWTAIWPASFRWVHNLYAKMTGLDKIYDLE